jgi:hypothetical protein
VRDQAKLAEPERMNVADVEEMMRSVLLRYSVPFTSIAVTSSPSAWKVIVYDETGMILRLPVPAGPRRRVLQAVLEAIEAEW